MNHTHEVEIPGASLDASIILRQVLASLIAGVTTEVSQTNDVQQISVNVISMDTGLKFSFVLPSAHAVAEAMIADIVMSDESPYPVQNRVIKAYVDGKFWTGTAAEYAALEDDTNIIGFLSDSNRIMYNGVSYSMNAHVHGNLTHGGAIGALAGMVVMTGAAGILEAVPMASLKELLGTSSGVNFLHNAEFASPFNTAGLTIYNTVAECLDRWSLLGGTLTVNNDYVTLSQASINTAQMRQTLPVGTYDRLMGQTLTLSVLLAEDETVYKGTGVIDGVATTIITVALDNGYLARLIVNNGARTAYVEIIGGTMVGAIDLLRAKFEIGSFPSIEDGVTDAAFDLTRVRAHDLSGAVRLDPLSVGLAHVSRHLIDGGFQIWLAGTSFTNPAASSYTATMWKLNPHNPDGGTFPTSLVHGKIESPAETTGYIYRITTNGAGSGYGANATYGIRQLIEHGTRNYAGAGKKVTVSFRARSSIAGKKIGVMLYQNYGTGGSPSAGEAINGANFTLTAAFQTFTHTFELNTLSGKTFGTAFDDSISFDFRLVWGSSIAPLVGASTAETFGGSGIIDICEVQVNTGSVALPFVPRIFAEELALCQRYYEKSYAYGTVPGTANTSTGLYFTGVFNTATANASRWSLGSHPFFSVVKRAAPTVTLYTYTGVSGQWDVPSGAPRASAASASERGFFVTNATGSSVTPPQGEAFGHWVADARM